MRVGVRTLRQKLMEYYAGGGNSDPFQFAIPKGGYRLTLINSVAIPDTHSVGQCLPGRATGAYAAMTKTAQFPATGQ